MEIFYIKLDEKNIKHLSAIELKKLQSKIGYYIVKTIGKEHFSISDISIIKENSKPRYKYSDIQFSITHSNLIVAAAFDNYAIGLDIEYMKNRDFEKLSKHYNINASDKNGFYKKWTNIEAEIKLQNNKKQSYTTEIESNYMMTVVSSNPKSIIPKIIKLDLNINDIIYS